MAMQARFYYLQPQAHRMVTKAIRHGDLIKPASCDNCQITTNSLDAHHVDYSRPLEVIWLCRSCHLRIHGAKNIIHSKAPDASQKVEAYLLEFPDAIHKPLEIARNLGVGKSTVYNVIKRMQPPPPPQN